MNFEVVTKFEEKIAEFFGAPFAIAVDSCTHGIELCLRYKRSKTIHCPRNTYLSIPMLANKLSIGLTWWPEGIEWNDYYFLGDDIIDGAVMWRKNSYTKGSLTCISFQYQKHLSLGRGGIILCDDLATAIQLKRMSYDGRIPDVPWRDQDIDTMGYHYYMTPEIAKLGLDKLDEAIMTKPKQWTIDMWPDLTKMKIFK